MSIEQSIRQKRRSDTRRIVECLACSQLFLVEESSSSDPQSFCSAACERKLLGPACNSCGETGQFFYPVYVRGVGMLPYCAACLNSGITEAHL